MLRKADGSVECVHDRHPFGVFSRAQWQRRVPARGLCAAPRERADPWRQAVFIARKG